MNANPPDLSGRCRQPVVDMQPVTLDTVVVGNRVFTNGEEEVRGPGPFAVPHPIYFLRTLQARPPAR